MSAMTVSIAGCFSYVEMPLDAAPIGAEYRLLLTRQRMDQLRDLDGSGLPDAGPSVVRGTLVRRDGTEILFRVPVVSRQVGFHQNEIDRQIRLGVGDIVQMERRQLDRGRTGLAMHLFILAFLNTGIFPLAMLALYPAFLGGSRGDRFGRVPS
ncbi:MAG: hypothetical protein EXR95_04270 [Gemmatimonadetes bacterium]|nr:hypothetical protein [Gemmatimonadota bacterium]